MTMQTVPLSSFVDFVLKVGTPKLGVVRELKDRRYDHLTDFYRPIREAIVEMHEKRRPLEALDATLAAMTDERKRRIFPDVIAGYRAFLSAHRAVWSTPPHAVLPMGALQIDVAPELGFEIDGVPHVVKPYFQGEPLAQKRVDLTIALMQAALSAGRPRAAFAVLDVPNARLRLLQTRADERLLLLLRGEAASFAAIHAAL
jgi:hypothetical protein